MFEFTPIPLLVGLGMLVVILAILWGRKRDLSYLFFFSMFWLYLLMVVSAVLFPIPVVVVTGVQASRQSAPYILSRINFRLFDYSQFSRLDPTRVFFREIVDNIVLTLPFGFLISFIVRFKGRNILWLAVATGLGIEATQLVLCLALGISYRGVDINDALMNALGVLLGYGLFLIFTWLILRIAKHYLPEPKGLFGYVLRIASQDRRSI